MTAHPQAYRPADRVRRQADFAGPQHGLLHHKCRRIDGDGARLSLLQFGGRHADRGRIRTKTEQSDDVTGGRFGPGMRKQRIRGFDAVPR